MTSKCPTCEELFQLPVGSVVPQHPEATDLSDGIRWTYTVSRLGGMRAVQCESGQGGRTTVQV